MFGFGGSSQNNQQYSNTKVIKLDLNLDKYHKKFHKFIADIEILIENLTLSNVLSYYN